MSEDLLESLSDSVLNRGGGKDLIAGRGRLQRERASKAVLGIVVHRFIRQQAALGLSLNALAAPRKISENTFHAHRSSAVETHCVEILLVSPPAPSGDFSAVRSVPADEEVRVAEASRFHRDTVPDQNPSGRLNTNKSGAVSPFPNTCMFPSSTTRICFPVTVNPSLL